MALTLRLSSCSKKFPHSFNVINSIVFPVSLNVYCFRCTNRKWTCHYHLVDASILTRKMSIVRSIYFAMKRDRICQEQCRREIALSGRTFFPGFWPHLWLTVWARAFLHLRFLACKWSAIASWHSGRYVFMMSEGIWPHF